MQEKSTKTNSAFWKTVRASVKSQHQAMAIKAAPRNEKLPLSFGQQRLWQVEQLQAESIVHNLCAVYRFQGTLNIPILKKSLQVIVQRHDILRTSFPTINGQPFQHISESLELKLPTVSLETIATEPQQTEIHRLMTEEVQQAFNLETGVLLRVKLLCLSDNEYILLKTIHHIISDRWSDSMFMRELALAYEALCLGKPLPLPKLPIQYADFAYEQRQTIQGERLEAKLNYWKAQLSGQLQLLKLPTDFPASLSTDYQGATQYITLSKNLTHSLTTFSYQEGVSLYVLLLAAFKVLLFRYSTQQDLIVSSPVAGRNRIETKKLIGYFNNMVLIRTQLKPELSFRELISQIAKLTSEALENQELPLQHLAENLHISGAILSRTMFALQNVPSQPLKMGAVRITPLDMDQGVANFDLSLSMKMTAEGLKGVMRYKVNLFKEATIRKILKDFNLLLETLVTSPDLHLLEHSLPVAVNQEPIKQAEKITSYNPPRNSLEQTIATIWQEVLGLDKVDIRTPFSDLGGRSIAMIQVQGKLQKILKRDILATELFKHSTVVKMALYLDDNKNDRETSFNDIRKRSAMQKAAIKRKQNQVIKSRRKLDD